MDRHFIQKNDDQLEKNIADKQFIFQKEMKKSGVDLIRISTDEDFVDPLMSFFRLREKKEFSDIYNYTTPIYAVFSRNSNYLRARYK